MNLLDIDVTGYETLFLDRDGVINRLRPNDYVKCWEEFEFLPGILEALTLWSQHFKHIIVVTNQRGVGKKIMTKETLDQIHLKMLTEIKAFGGRIDKIYCCTALRDEDPNRKPNPGMGYQAKKDFPDLDFSKSIMIGDSESDLEFAKKLGIYGVRI